jgi:hypothetical protein
MHRWISDKREWLFFTLEIRHFFSSGQTLKFLPLSACAVFMVLWPYIGSPFVPVIAAAVTGLEPQFCNLLFRSPHEYEALAMFPLSWERVIIAKNLATAALVLLMVVLVSLTVLYFSPVFPRLWDLADLLLYLATVVFPLIHAGNLRSVQQPRRVTGLTTTDLAEALVLLVILGLFSLPYLFLHGLPWGPALCLLYAAATVVFWIRVSVPGTAGKIRREHERICHTP